MRRIVIIGFGPVAARLIEELEEPLAQSRVHVCVIGSEPEGAYNRILLANLVTGHSTPQDLDLACDETNFPEGVTFLTGTTLSDISLDGQYLHTTDDRLISFDDLIFATGARAVLPRVPGLDVLDTDPCHLDSIPLPGVHPLAGHVRRSAVTRGGRDGPGCPGPRRWDSGDRACAQPCRARSAGELDPPWAGPDAAAAGS